MLLYSDETIKEEFNRIVNEEKLLESEYQTIIGEIVEKDSLDDESKERISSGLFSLYDKKRELIDRLHEVIRAIDERWLASPNGEESMEMTLLFNEASGKIDSVRDQAYQIRRTLNNLS